MIGMMVEVRPWKRGRQAARPVRGIILMEIGDAVAVWFPSKGAPGGDEGMQMFYKSEVEPRRLAEAPESWIQRAAQAMAKAGGCDRFPEAARKLGQEAELRKMLAQAR